MVSCSTEVASAGCSTLQIKRTLAVAVGEGVGVIDGVGDDVGVGEAVGVGDGVGDAVGVAVGKAPAARKATLCMTHAPPFCVPVAEYWPVVVTFRSAVMFPRPVERIE